jgi:hypothetical protein
MPNTATKATALPEPGWGEAKSGRPTFVQHGFRIDPPPVLKGFFPWWVSRTEQWVKWTYRPLADLKKSA